MGFVVDTTGGVASGERKFTPIPAGEYEATVYDAEIKSYKEGGANAGRPNVNFQFRISDGQPRANSRLFETVGIFTKWAPTAKNPDGYDNWNFFRVFATLLGKKEKEFRAEVTAAIEAAPDKNKVELPIPDPTTLLGKPLVLVIDTEDDDYAFKQYEKAVASGDEEPGQTQADFKRNIIKAFKPAGSATAGAANAKSAADDGLITL